MDVRKDVGKDILNGEECYTGSRANFYTKEGTQEPNILLDPSRLLCCTISMASTIVFIVYVQPAVPPN
eukprot:1162077-Pelagomonas_calceolata.AAC.2